MPCLRARSDGDAAFNEVLNAIDGAGTGIDVYAGYKADMVAEYQQYQQYQQEMMAEIRADMAAEYRDNYGDEY